MTAYLLRAAILFKAMAALYVSSASAVPYAHNHTLIDTLEKKNSLQLMFIFTKKLSKILKLL